ncbi:hypothetical protein EPO14_01255 [Patescibacteria group bacterium]|nr:MAG: hypothetical protein EPO14_01255 [Patescibacteria group bacterium]
MEKLPNPHEFRKEFGSGYSATFVETDHGVDWSHIDSPQWSRGDEPPEQVIGKRRLAQGLREAKAYFHTKRPRVSVKE